MRSSTIAALLVLLLAACSISDEQEVAFGRENAQRINEAMPLVTDPRATAYLSELGRSIASRTSRSDLVWHFALVNSDEVNAFALPGGYIYVNRGLVERAERLEQLAGVLGHEIGHVVERHSVEQMKKTTGANVVVTLICAVTSLCESGISQVAINVAGTAILARYSRADEIEADSQAVVNVVNAGIHPSGVPEFFQALLLERSRNPSSFDTFFASHPVEESRVNYTERLIASYDPDRLEALVSDDPGYQQFRAVLQALPPAPPPRQLPSP
jgi:beta-barrel assembly-enhancing protease